MIGPVAVLTTPAHRAGKRIGEHLVVAGWDLGFWGLAAMRARAAWVEARGHRVANVRGDIADPVAVRRMVAATREVFDAVDAVVHVEADLLAYAQDGSDPATAALTELGASTIVYLAEPAWDPTVTRRWCSARGIEAVVLDATDKVHNLAPGVLEALGG